MPAGRPVKFKTPEELLKKGKKWLKGRKRVTIAGLSVALGLSRQGFYEYGNKDEFSDAVKELRTMVEAKIEEAMMWDHRGQAGKIFWMKNNAGYADKQDIDVSGTIHARFDSEDEESL